MGKVLDGFSEHMADYDERRAFVIADALEADHHEVVRVLRDSGAEILVNYLPVGSERGRALLRRVRSRGGRGAGQLHAGLHRQRSGSGRSASQTKGLPMVGDDIKAQLGATITHRTLTDLFRKRGVKLERTYQLNTGGNTDFLNMLNREPSGSRRRSRRPRPCSPWRRSGIPDANIHVGPSDYVPWQNDNKVCFLRMEGKLFGDVPMNLELRLSVEDSPNSAGVSIDAIRCCKLALDRGDGRCAARALGLLHEAPAAAVHRRRGPPDDRGVHRGGRVGELSRAVSPFQLRANRPRCLPSPS